MIEGSINPWSLSKNKIKGKKFLVIFIENVDLSKTKEDLIYYMSISDWYKDKIEKKKRGIRGTLIF